MAETQKTQLLVIGAGPGGYPAALHAADHGLSVTLVDEDNRLGGVCLNRGCIPSKALLHVAKLIHEVRALAEHGVRFEGPQLDLERLRTYVQKQVVGRLNTGIAQLTKARGVRVLTGQATFLDPHTVLVHQSGQGEVTLRFDHCVLAPGSLPVVPRAWQIDPQRIWDSTAALSLPDIPSRLLVIGGGYIGLEIGTVYAALGSQVTVVEALEGLLPMADRDLVLPLEKRLRQEFSAIYVNTRVADLQATEEGIAVTLEGRDVPERLVFDRVLVAVGRRPNTAHLNLDKAGVQVDERGYIRVDEQRRTNVHHIFAVGDAAGEPGLAHKATAEARVAIEALVGEPAAWQPRAIPAVVFTDPEIAWAGLTEKQAQAEGIPHEVLKFPWVASGRAVTLDRTEGLTKLLVEPESKRILGVGMVGVGVGDMIAEGVLAIEMGAVARDLLETIHPHPTLSETLMECAELAYGSSVHIARSAVRPKSTK
jgi:dihydrolipoamide dehydrogenase